MTVSVRGCPPTLDASRAGAEVPRAWEAVSDCRCRLMMQLSGHRNRPLLTVGDRCEPLLGARRGHGWRGPRGSEPAGYGTSSCTGWASSSVAPASLAGARRVCGRAYPPWLPARGLPRGSKCSSRRRPGIATQPGRVSLDPRLGVPASLGSPRRAPVPVGQVRVDADDDGAATMGTQRPTHQGQGKPLSWLRSADRIPLPARRNRDPCRRPPSPATQPAILIGLRMHSAARIRSCCLISSPSSGRSPLCCCPSHRSTRRGDLTSEDRTVGPPWNCR